uniref:Uncharacterized protein n=1 Tax=Oryzias melastigma TaxID=30732 RepID=A0A3B3CX23_ORYME
SKLCCGCVRMLVPVLATLIHLCAAFNLDPETRAVFSGPRGSYFGYSVEFFSNSSSVLIGAPKANTSQPNITEGGAVFLCPWRQSNCSIINFDEQGDRYFYVNDVYTQVEFKSHQWFGATVRSHGNNTLVRCHSFVDVQCRCCALWVFHCLNCKVELF